jgi:hypothetical protein
MPMTTLEEQIELTEAETLEDDFRWKRLTPGQVLAARLELCQDLLALVANDSFDGLAEGVRDDVSLAKVLLDGARASLRPETRRRVQVNGDKGGGRWSRKRLKKETL